VDEKQAIQRGLLQSYSGHTPGVGTANQVFITTLSRENSILWWKHNQD